MQAQRRYFAEHKEKILGEKGARFAMIHSNKAEYFPDRNSLYKIYPHLAPEAEPTFGNFPMLVDIGGETGSLEYRKNR